ncbi:hypothetical protein BH23BAC1_BH23BAC1_24960 [soil metagenome]
MKLFYTSLLLLLLISSTVKSQETTSREQASNWDLGLEGMLGFSVGQNFYSMNVGGPSLFLILNNDWKIGIGALPSIYILNDKLGARLGVSPRVDYKNLVLIAPFFHRDAVDEWVWSIGLGYKFHRKK